MQDERARRGAAWPDLCYGLERRWHHLYRRMRGARRRGRARRVLLAGPAGMHRLCTMLVARVALGCRHPRLCLSNPWLLIRLPRRGVKSALLRETGMQSLAEVAAASQEAGVKPFLVFGTLLGHCREGGFIAHDADIDLGVLKADGAGLDCLEAAMRARGWALKRARPQMISFAKPFYGSVTVDFFLFRVRSGTAYCTSSRLGPRLTRAYVYPAGISSSFRPALFGGRVSVLIPERAAEFLAVTYGDWREPKPRWDRRHDACNLRMVAREGAEDGVGPEPPQPPATGRDAAGPPGPRLSGRREGEEGDA